MNNHDFIDRLLQKPQNPLWVIVLCNILDGLDSGLYGDDFVKDAITQWRENFLECKVTEPAANEDKLLQAALDMLSILLPSSSSGRPKPDMRVRCCYPLTTAISSYAHSMRAASFVHRVLHADDRIALLADGKLGTGKKYFIEDSIPLTVRIQSGEGIGKTGGIVFLTPFAKVANLLANSTKADDVRDKVGLIHWEKNEEYVMLEIKSSELTSLRQGRPTFVDAGSHRRFKAVASNRSNKTQSDWGFTLDLGSFATRGKIVDGVPERVCEQIGAHCISAIKLHPLNSVKDVNRGMTANDNDMVYAIRLCRKRSLKKIKTDIKGII